MRDRHQVKIHYVHTVLSTGSAAKWCYRQHQSDIIKRPINRKYKGSVQPVNQILYMV